MRASRSLILGLLLAGPVAGDAGFAAVPTGDPVFSSPLAIDNAFFPFAPGAVKVFSGRSGRARTTLTDLYTGTTRDFTWAGGSATCRVLQETEFEDGALAEISTNYFAQADDGTVWYFGELVDTYEDGVVTGHEGSWVVGTPAAEDPPGTASASAPNVFMPANPEVGDEFMPEDTPPVVQETDDVLRTGLKVRVPAGRMEECIEVHELGIDGDTEVKWYAPGVGVIKGKARGETFTLVASTLRQ